MLKNILFDLSEVIICGYNGIEYEIENHTKVNSQEFLNRKLAKNNVFLELMRGKMTEEEYLFELLRDTNWDITIKDLQRLIRQNLSKYVPGTIEIIKKLKNKYKLILVSDYVLEWKNYILDTNKDLKIFDEMYFSCDLGSLKCDDGTFLNILDLANIKSEETLFIDDSKINIKKAIEQGLKAIIFTNALALEQELIRLGILEEEDL